VYQAKKAKQKLTLLAKRTIQGLAEGFGTQAARKRNESNQRKLRIISQTMKSNELQSPKINAKKQTYYPQSLFQQYFEMKQRKQSLSQSQSKSFFLVRDQLPSQLHQDS